MGEPRTPKIFSCPSRTRDNLAEVMTTVASTSYADANHKVEANKPQGCGRTPPRPVQSKLQSYPPAVGEPTASGTLFAASQERDKGPTLCGAGPSAPSAQLRAGRSS